MTASRESVPPARRSAISAVTWSIIVIVLLVLWFARDVVLLAFGGVLVSIFLRHIASWVSARTRLGPRASLGVVTLLLAGSLIGAVVLSGPSIAREVRALRTELPKAVSELRARLSQYEWAEQALEQAPRAAETMTEGGDALAGATGILSTTLGGIAGLVIVFFLGIVLAATPGVYRKGVLALVPERKLERANEVLDTLGNTLWWWLIGRVISMTVIGVGTWIGLMLLGVPLAFLLALMTALLSFIPNVGPILSAVPAILLAFVDGPRQALWVAGLYAFVQAVESYILEPIVDRKTIHLPPALTITAQLTMAVFTGIVGVALATPLLAVVVVLTTMLYVQDVLGRRDVELSRH